VDGPREDAYDVVVIGSGLGGLSSGALLAHAGLRVLVVEQGDGPGGYARAFKRGPYTFDPAMSVFPQGHDDALPAALLEHLGVRDRCEMLPLTTNYRAVFPEYAIDTPFGLDDFIATHRQAFPSEAAGIETFFRLCRQLHKEAHELPPHAGLDGLGDVVRRFPVLFKYVRATLADALDEHLQDPLLKAVASVSWPYVGVPPSRLSLVTFATLLSVYLEGGFYPRGGFQSLVEALVEGLLRGRGELVLGQEATGILIEDGSVVGVELAREQRVRCRSVISNADAAMTFERLVGADHLPPPFLRRLRRMEPSLSAVVVFIATTMDLGAASAAHEVFRPLHLDHDQTYEDILRGRPGGMFADVPTLADPGLAPTGEHILIVRSLARFDIGRPWSEEVEDYTQAVLAAYETVFPGLGESIRFLETATPLALERHSRNQRGAAYGWENTPRQTGSKRSSHTTPISGLFLSGHWTQPGTGSLRAVVSGMHAAQIVLRSTGSPGLDFDHPDFPPV
jgi:prolycopene isomerase